MIVPPFIVTVLTVPKSVTVAPLKLIVDAPLAFIFLPFKLISHSFICALTILLSGLEPVTVAPESSTSANFEAVPKSVTFAPEKSIVPPEKSNLDPVTLEPVTIFEVIVLTEKPPVELADTRLVTGLLSEFSLRTVIN